MSADTSFTRMLPAEISIAGLVEHDDGRWGALPPPPPPHDGMSQQRLSLRTLYQERLGSDGGALGGTLQLMELHLPEPQMLRDSAMALVTPLREINNMSAGPTIGPLQRGLNNRGSSGGGAHPDDDGESKEASVVTVVRAYGNGMTWHSCC